MKFKKKDRCERMKKLEQLYEGKAKKVFATEDPDVVIVDYKDDATAFNGEKKGTIVGKGVINNRIPDWRRNNELFVIFYSSRSSFPIHAFLKNT